MTTTKLGHLRLVPESTPRPAPVQGDLFANQRVLWVVRWNIRLSGDVFVQMIAQMSPLFLFDLRRAPTFDLPGLTRKRALSYFESRNIWYCDLAVSFSSQEEPAETLWRAVDDRTRVGRCTAEKGITRPCVAIVENTKQASTLRSKLPVDAFPGDWSVRELVSGP